jgi:hypothetical protein
MRYWRLSRSRATRTKAARPSKEDHLYVRRANTRLLQISAAAASQSGETTFDGDRDRADALRLVNASAFGQGEASLVGQSIGNPGQSFRAIILIARRRGHPVS